ncbi:hypothetical protein AURDEDRAFT_159087 [Auricularia subglabra TFB-10046 SS5]|nr:hypothetical protein AURDEDRAFT_159087 [Auricularia subglabra TFB-10046 SS5]
MPIADGFAQYRGLDNWAAAAAAERGAWETANPHMPQSPAMMRSLASPNNLIELPPVSTSTPLGSAELLETTQ